MLLAEGAVLAQLDAVGVVLLVFGRGIVTLLALIASEGYLNTHKRHLLGCGMDNPRRFSNMLSQCITESGFCQ
jgi:hypothetical protein